jgi:hypothetical protein
VITAVPVVFALAQIFSARGPRVQRPPGLPCALGFLRVMVRQSSGEFRRENTGACLTVVIASEAKQPRAARVALDCFVTLRLAMTVERVGVPRCIAPGGTGPTTLVDATMRHGPLYLQGDSQV